MRRQLVACASIEPGTRKRIGKARARAPHETLDAQPVRRAFKPPSVRGDCIAEQPPCHVLLRCAFEEGIGDAELEDPLRRAALARHQRRRQIAPLRELGELPECREAGFERSQPGQPVLDQQRSAEQCSVVEVETYRPMTVAQEPVLGLRGDFDRD